MLLRYNPDQSRYMNIHDLAPSFILPDLHGKMHCLEDYRGRIVIVNFWSCECPHSRRTDERVLSMLRGRGEDIVLLPIASNRSETPEALARAAEERGLPLVLRDAEHTVADLYAAETTPHVFVMDRQGRLRYRGAVDDVTLRQRIPTRFFLDEVVGALLEGRVPPLMESPAYGCAIVREM